MKTLCAVLILLVYGKAMGKAEAVREKEDVNNRSVFIITLDGFRWQELFSGADKTLLQQAPEGDTTHFYHEDQAVRRQLLMPFMWQVVARQGQLLGNRSLGNKVNVSNPYALSYAGYNELFTGRPDLLIWNNEAQANQNTTVLEKLNGIASLRGKIGSIGSWGMFPYIFNKKRSRLFINAGKEKAGSSDVRADLSTFEVAKNYIIEKQPRVLHIGLGGTDEAGHNRRYEQYLQQANLADGIIARLWNLVQSLSCYRDKTTFIITTDHGRGEGRSNWHKHGFFVRGSSQSWVALLGSGVLPLGEHAGQGQIYSRQVAGTIRFLLQASPSGLSSLPLSFFTGQDVANVPPGSTRN